MRLFSFLTTFIFYETTKRGRNLLLVPRSVYKSIAMSFTSSRSNFPSRTHQLASSKLL